MQAIQKLTKLMKCRIHIFESTYDIGNPELMLQKSESTDIIAVFKLYKNGDQIVSINYGYCIRK